MAPGSVDSIGYIADEGLDTSIFGEQNPGTSSTELYPLTVPGFEDLRSMLDVSQTSQDETVQIMGGMHNLNGWQTAESVGSPLCWPGNGLAIGLSGDTFTAEDMNSMNVATSQILEGLPTTYLTSSLDVPGPISRTSSLNTLDDTWRVAAMANSPINFMSYSMSTNTKLHHIVPDTEDTISFSGDMNMTGNYRRRSSVESDSPCEEHRYKNAVRKDDGLFHCPWEDQQGCNHKPEKRKCNYDKYVDSHLKPYKCKFAGCEEVRFSANANLLRHEREAHGLHGHGQKSFRCSYPDCKRGQEGNGFPRQWNCRDHMKRIHNKEAAE